MQVRNYSRDGSHPIHDTVHFAGALNRPGHTRGDVLELRPEHLELCPGPEPISDSVVSHLIDEAGEDVEENGDAGDVGANRQRSAEREHDPPTMDVTWYPACFGDGEVHAGKHQRSRDHGRAEENDDADDQE